MAEVTKLALWNFFCTFGHSFFIIPCLIFSPPINAKARKRPTELKIKNQSALNKGKFFEALTTHPCQMVVRFSVFWQFVRRKIAGRLKGKYELSGLWFLLLVMKNDDVTMWTKLSKDVRIMRFNNKSPGQVKASQQWLQKRNRNGKRKETLWPCQSLSVYLSHD